MEVETFCRILADSEFNFAATLETKALKQTAKKEVFETIQMTLKTAILEEDFIKENRVNFHGIDPYPELDLSIPKLRNKYNNIKRQWRQRLDRAKMGLDWT